VRAHEQGLAHVSHVALFKRLRSSEAWLRALTGSVLAGMPVAPLLTGPHGPYRLRAIDATFIQEPGSTGTNWLLHYCLSLPDLTCDFFEITDAHGAEHLRHLPVVAGDVVLGDRAYSKRSGLAAILRAGAHAVVRLLPSSVPLTLENGAALPPPDLALLLERVLRHPGQSCELDVRMEFEGEVFPLRLCAVRKTVAAEAAARRQARNERERKGGTVREVTLGLASFVCVLTSLPREEVSGPDILQLYRCRWQVELAFKRLKSLLEAGHLPKKDPRSCRAWMQAKVLIALLTDRLVLESELFSPWGCPLGG
jgi:hypothetical protein